MNLSGEFENQIRKNADGESAEKIIEVINSAGAEFPCLICPCNEECDTFIWFTKWFGKVSLP
jgi:hypothetical protein